MCAAVNGLPYNVAYRTTGIMESSEPHCLFGVHNGLLYMMKARGDIV